MPISKVDSHWKHKENSMITLNSQKNWCNLEVTLLWKIMKSINWLKMLQKRKKNLKRCQSLKLKKFQSLKSLLRTLKRKKHLRNNKKKHLSFKTHWRRLRKLRLKYNKLKQMLRKQRMRKRRLKQKLKLQRKKWKRLKPRSKNLKVIFKKKWDRFHLCQRPIFKKEKNKDQKLTKSLPNVKQKRAQQLKNSKLVNTEMLLKTIQVQFKSWKVLSKISHCSSKN